MPDDDYEKTVSCGCGKCSTINTNMEKSRKINELLFELSKPMNDASLNSLGLCLEIKTMQIVEILMLMNKE